MIRSHRFESAIVSVLFLLLSVTQAAAAGRPESSNGLAGEPESSGSFLVQRDHSGSSELPLDAVHCDADRLVGLLGRAEIRPLNGSPANWLNLSLTPSGDFAGVAFVEGPVGATVRDARLVFSTNPEIPALLRNPARPQLSTISLTRNRVASDLVTSGDPAAMRFVINPTLDLVAPNPEAILVVDNLTDAGTLAQAKPGRGLDPLKTPCHAGYSERDLLVLRILSRILEPSSEVSRRFDLAIYRDRDPYTYRIDVFPRAVDGESLGRLAARLTTVFDRFDQLVTGTLELLPSCSAVGERDCTDVPFETTLTMAYPAFRGDPIRQSSISVSGSLGGSTAATAAIDWSNLLAGTTWRGIPR